MDYFSCALQYLPPRALRAAQVIPQEMRKNVCEIRLRSGLPISFTTYKSNVFVSEEGRICTLDNALRLSSCELEECVGRLCRGSVYRYADSLKKGCIVTPEGLRAGICGQALYDDGKMELVEDYTAVNIRIPHYFFGCDAPFMRYVRQKGLCSALIFSPPGVGKTTLIRHLAISLSHSFVICVVDERGEILPQGMTEECGMCDVVRGYPKHIGMDIAVRTLSPQVIICDEIGMQDDIPAILSVQNSGVHLIATAHAHSLEAARRKPNIKLLCDTGVFEKFVRLEKADSGFVIAFEGD